MTTNGHYDPYKLAIELGFDAEQASRFAWNGTDATNMRSIAKHLGLPSTKPTLGKPETKPADSKAEPKKHSHYYHKDTGVCSCGASRKVEAKAAS